MACIPTDLDDKENVCWSSLENMVSAFVRCDSIVLVKDYRIMSTKHTLIHNNWCTQLTNASPPNPNNSS